MRKHYAIEYTKESLKYLARLDSKLSDQIRFEIYRLSQGYEESLDTKLLKGFTTDTYRMRIRNIRIIYRKEDHKLVIVVLKIGPRGDIYKK